MLLPWGCHGFGGVVGVRREKPIHSTSEAGKGKQPSAKKLTDV